LYKQFCCDYIQPFKYNWTSSGIAKMGFFEKFKLRRMEKGAERWGRWCAKAMIFSFSVAKHQYKGVAPTYAWLARKALLNRNYWKQINETDFLFEKSNDNSRFQTK